MNKPMRILIGYDGSEYSDNAVASLERAGLPATADVLVVTIAEVWLKSETPSPAEAEDAAAAHVMSVHALQGLQRAEFLARTAADRLRAMFPGWSIDTKVYPDSPAWGILRAEAEWGPDLIVIGSHGRSAIARLILGSVSQKVLTEAHASVRIARSVDTIAGSPVRLVVGVDDTPDAMSAVDVIAARTWPAGSSVRVMAVIEPADVPIGVPANYDVTQWVAEGTQQLRQRMEAAAHNAVEKLRAAGLIAETVIREGVPVSMLVEEAANLDADCIFLGARGHRFMERFLLGCVSAAVAARAECSVEVVRPAANAS